MRAVVICADPEQTTREPGSVATLLVELGGRVSLGRFDLGGLDEEELVAYPPVAVIVEAGDELQRAQKTIQKIRDGGPLVEVPIMIAVTVARLPSLDFSIGFDDFVLMPIVPAELYARMRQLDWKSATFGSDEVIKIDDLVIDIAGYEAKIGGRRRSHASGVRAAAVPRAASRPGVHAPGVARTRVGLRVRRRHTHGRHSRAPRTKQARPGG